jgi:hypothetical protein
MERSDTRNNRSRETLIERLGEPPTQVGGFVIYLDGRMT